MGRSKSGPLTEEERRAIERQGETIAREEGDGTGEMPPGEWVYG